MNYKSINFLILIALFIGFSSGARADFKWDTLWVKDYTNITQKLIPMPGVDKTYGSVGDYDDPIWYFVEFSELTGDSLRKLCDFGGSFEPFYRYKDTNIVLGNGTYGEAVYFNIHTGEQKPIWDHTSSLVYYYPEENNVVVCDNGTLFKYSLDSNKMLMYPALQPGWLESGNICWNYVSPKGTYLYRIGYGPRNGEPEKTVFRDYIINADDFSYKKILTDTIVDREISSKEFGYGTGVFNDSETLLALCHHGSIEIFDLTTNIIVKSISFDGELDADPFIFDTTGKYLIFALSLPNHYMIAFLNTETYQIDYMTEDFPFNVERIPFTNILYNDWRRLSIKELGISSYDELSHKCNINYNSQILNINSDTQQQISSIYIYDSNARTVYQNNNSALTPISANIELTPGVYFIILKIDGKNEYHKVLVY